MMKLEGEIGEVGVIERLVELGREQFTGAVRYENEGVIKIIYFKTGDVLSASTNDRNDSIDEILLRAGKVNRDHVKQALAKRKESETLGDALLNLGFITRKELTWARRMQVIGVIRSIDSWATGSYTIVADYLPKREEGTLFPLSQMLVELIVTDPDREKIERALDSGNAVFGKTAEFDESFRRIGLNQDAEEIAAHIDGRNSAADIAAASGKDEFNVYRLLHALATLGLLQRGGGSGAPRVQAAAPPDDFDFAAAGVSDANDMWGAPTAAAPAELPTFNFDDEPPTTAAPTAVAFGASDVMDRPLVDEPPQAQWSEPVPNSFDSPLWDDMEVTPAGQTIPHPAPREEQWGFDEAQIETARRAAIPAGPRDAVPHPMREEVARAAKPNRWVFLLLAAAALIAITFGGLAVWNWWQAKNAASEAELRPVPSARRHRPVPPPVAPVSESATTATTSTVLTEAPTAVTATGATTTTVTPAVTPAPVPPPATTTTPLHVERSPAGIPVVTSNPPARTAAPASADAMRSHYDDMARTFAAQASGTYTVQVELSCQTASITRAINAGGSSIWFVPVSYRGQGCYRVFWGHFVTKAEAERAMASIPGALRAGNKPVVVTVPK